MPHHRHRGHRCVSGHDRRVMALLAAALCVCVVLSDAAAHQDPVQLAARAAIDLQLAGDDDAAPSATTSAGPPPPSSSSSSSSAAAAASLLSVRCFCNLPACISTGYMCKSTFGGCFSDVRADPASGYRGRHGCVEYLSDREQRDRCRRLPDGSRYPAAHRGAAHARALVHCCHEDMCNHADSPQTRDLMLGDAGTPPADADADDGVDTRYGDADVWLKAATIAVPICGAVILFVLIAMAIRLLRTESSLNHAGYKLGCHLYASGGKHVCRRALPTPIVLAKGGSECKQHTYEYDLLPLKKAAAHAYDNAIKADKS